METVTFRHADSADAAPLARFAADVFQEAFGSANRAENMEKHLESMFDTAKQEREIANPAMSTLLAEAGGTLAGYAQLLEGEFPATVHAPSPIGLIRFYVEQAWRGRGVAHDLMTAVLEEAQRRHAGSVWLGVWERNPRAIAFYRKEGFVDVGSHPFMLGSEIQVDRVMVRVIGGHSK